MVGKQPVLAALTTIVLFHNSFHRLLLRPAPAVQSRNTLLDGRNLEITRDSVQTVDVVETF